MVWETVPGSRFLLPNVAIDKSARQYFQLFPSWQEISGLCQMVLMTSKTSLQKWSGVFLFPSVSPVFFQIGTVTYQHRLRFRWRRFMYEFLPLIRKARTRCDLCRALHDFARLRLTSQFLPAGNYGWRKCIQRDCLKNTSSVSF